MSADLKTCAPSESNDTAPPAKKARPSPPPPSITTDKPKSQQTKMSLALPPLLSPTLPPSIEEELSKLPKSSLHLNGHPGHKKTDSTTSSSSEKKPSSSQKLSSPTTHDARPSQKDKSIAPYNKPGNKSSSAASATPTKTTHHSSKLAEHSKGSYDTKQRTSTSNTAERANKSIGNAGANSSQRSDSNARKEPATPLTAAPNADKESKILRLKIPKSRRNDFRRILHMKPRPKKADLGSIARREDREESFKDKLLEKDRMSTSDKDRDRHRQDRDSVKDIGEMRKDHAEDPAKQLSREKDITTDRTKPVEKRRRSDDDGEAVEPANKRQKSPPVALDLTQKPRTPIPPPFKSPALSQHGSAQKSHVSTPMRDIKGVAMRRIESGEGDARTPQGRVGTPTAPGSAEKVGRNGRSASNTSSATTSSLPGKAEEALAWRAENKKYSELGRTLKHDADAFFNPKDNHAKVEPEDEKRGVAIAIETVLSYMLAFTASDEGSRAARKPRDITAWQSLLPYLQFIKPRIRRFSILYGLCLQLEAICRETIHTFNLERLDRDPLPTAAADGTRVPTPGTDVDTAASEAAAKATQYRNYMDFKTQAIDNSRKAQKLWAEGTFKLSVATLQQSFPATWEAKAKVPLAWTPEAVTETTTEATTERPAERLVPGKWAGEFYLPLSCSSLAIEGVRAGWSLLGEWCEREGVKWEGKLRL